MSDDDLEAYWADLRPKPSPERPLPAIGQWWVFDGETDDRGLERGRYFVVTAVEPKCGERTVQLESGHNEGPGLYYVRVVVDADWRMPLTWSLLPEAERRKAEVLRKTGRPWDPVHNWDPNISCSGRPCADDDR